MLRRFGQVAVWLAAAAALAPVPHSHASPPTDWQRGMNLVAWNRTGYSEVDSPGVRTMSTMSRDGGIGTVVLTPTNYASPGDTRNPSTIDRRWTDGSVVKNESNASVRHAACAARVGVSGGYDGPGGLTVALKPQVDPKGFGFFRGEIDPHGANLDTFWAAYSKLIVHYARLAIESGASTLVVGTELSALTAVTDGRGTLVRNDAGEAVPEAADTARWQALIDRVRSARAPRWSCPGPDHRARPLPGTHRFSGDGIQAAYASNWASMSGVGFWDSVDRVGTDFYWNGQSLDQSFAKIAAVEGGIRARTGSYKPFVYTEIGYDGASDPAGVGLASADQNRAAQYRDAFEFWSAKVSGGEAPWFDGFWWWDRYADADPGWPGGKRDAWTPGELAMQALCSWQC